MSLYSGCQEAQKSPPAALMPAPCHCTVVAYSGTHHLHCLLASFSYYLGCLCIEPSEGIRAWSGQGPASVLPSEDKDDPSSWHPGPQQACPIMCPAPTQAIISAQAWVQVQETWSTSHPSPFEYVAWPGSLFAKVLLIPADLPLIVGTLLFLLLPGQGLASATKTCDGHACEHICKLP